MALLICIGKVEDDQIEINYGNFGELEDVKLEVKAFDVAMANSSLKVGL